MQCVHTGGRSFASRCPSLNWAAVFDLKISKGSSNNTFPNTTGGLVSVSPKKVNGVVTAKKSQGETLPL
jgi:hypothetical protein